MPRAGILWRTVAFWLLLGCAASILGAQTPQPASPPQTATVDPLGRSTPLGTLTGVSAAVHTGDLASAAQYLQAGGRSARQAENLAHDLKDLLDRYFIDALTTVSSEPMGALDDGLPPDRERFTLHVGDRVVDLYLVRVTDPNAGQIWLVSSDSLERVPSLLRSPRATLVELLMPEA